MPPKASGFRATANYFSDMSLQFSPDKSFSKSVTLSLHDTTNIKIPTTEGHIPIGVRSFTFRVGYDRSIVVSETRAREGSTYYGRRVIIPAHKYRVLENGLLDDHTWTTLLQIDPDGGMSRDMGRSSQGEILSQAYSMGNAREIAAAMEINSETLMLDSRWSTIRASRYVRFIVPDCWSKKTPLFDITALKTMLGDVGVPKQERGGRQPSINPSLPVEDHAITVEEQKKIEAKNSIIEQVDAPDGTVTQMADIRLSAETTKEVQANMEPVQPNEETDDKGEAELEDCFARLWGEAWRSYKGSKAHETDLKENSLGLHYVGVGESKVWKYTTRIASPLCVSEL
ncbi:hypothetical protein PMZ80_006566 [Knufia obscura]|uniref:Uncharacterized protein n=1 Tax=Knufia obscura TaxID=1635080 RepID=A0ABR0RM31_9EURO|nr:hypothetical protein PMZ80_006566 [Knufia obscura]